MFKTVIIFLLLTIITIPSAIAEDKSPALWQVSDDDTKVYITGSIHMIKENTTWNASVFDDILSNSNELILEYHDPNSQQIFDDIFAHKGRYSQGYSLRDFISSETYSIVEKKLFELNGIKKRTILTKPWNFIIHYSMAKAREQGRSSDNALEAYFIQAALRKGLRISGIETIEESFSFLMEASSNFPDQLIMASINEVDKDYDNLWASGDVEGIYNKMIISMRSYPDFYSIILTARNKVWATRIKEIMTDPGEKLLVVGVGHLVGEQSLIELLRNEGVVVTRVQ